MDRKEMRTVLGMINTVDNYEFAPLSAADIEEISNAQNKLNQDREKEIILLAYEKK